jgi:hypothetical protein
MFMPFAFQSWLKFGKTGTAVAGDVDPRTALANTVVPGPLLPNW